MADRNAAAVRTYVVEVETAALVCMSSFESLNFPYSLIMFTCLLPSPRPPYAFPTLPHKLTKSFSPGSRRRRHPITNPRAQRILALRQATNSRHQRSRKASRRGGRTSRSWTG